MSHLLFVFFISTFMKSSTVYGASLCTFVRFETMIWPSIRFDISLQNFKKPSDIFSRKKTLRRIFSYKFGCRKKTLSDFLASSSSLKKATPGSWLTCLREWKLLSLYMFHRIIILLLIFCSLFINFHRCCAVCFQSLMNIACRSSQNATDAYQTFLKITHRYKTIR